ncbi:hypothetical protein GALL_494930 [mine drainage metagenome]|uniref:Uncharacterized protein n=1 Tax=mine drainage metagenome TaxID=410659 RepID=A0A1J5PC40_9ZZZZ
MNGCPQIKGLQAATASIPITKTHAHGIENPLNIADRLTGDEFSGFCQRCPDGLATRHFANPGPPGTVAQDQQIAGEEGTMSAR